MASPEPAWRRRTQGDHRWFAALAIAVAAMLQVLLPDIADAPDIGVLTTEQPFPVRLDLALPA